MTPHEEESLEQARAAAVALEQQNTEALRLVREALHYLPATAPYPAARVTLQQAETLLAGDDA